MSPPATRPRCCSRPAMARAHAQDRLRLGARHRRARRHRRSGGRRLYAEPRLAAAANLPQRLRRVADRRRGDRHSRSGRGPHPADRHGGRRMKVFVFDLLAYDANLDHLKGGETELPYPLAKRHFDAATAERTYAEHLDAWEALDRFGYDGVGFNEHHCSPYGLMNSPNLMAASAAQRTKDLKLLIYGNLLPLHEPLRLAEELAMLDCLSNGRLISGFARGIPREYQVHNVPLAESRARFEEAYDIVNRAWREVIFSYQGKFWSYKDVAIWPRPVQKPGPEIWIPIVGSKESIEFAAKKNAVITPGLARGGLQEDIIRYFAKCLVSHGHQITPHH